LVGNRTEKAAFTFCGDNWKAPFQGSFFEVVEGLLDGVSSFQWITGGRTNDKIISIE